MSLATFKKKGVINYGSNKSARGPVAVWLPQGPFGPNGRFQISNTDSGPGFSINGGIRTNTYIGKNSMMSKNGSSFKGIYAKGHGGHVGSYYKAEPVLNMNPAYADINGNQHKYIKPSSLSFKGMLERKYMWIHNGKYPNYWVQPDNNLTYNHTQWLYIQQKAAANQCVRDVNNSTKYEGLCKPNNIDIHTATFNTIASNGSYTKTINQSIPSSQYTLQIQKPCANPIGSQKPFPFAANNGFRNSSGSTNNTCPPIAQVYYLEPPEWYIK
jgi:hypothetical protein